jgi:hypothetical protein
MNVRGKERRGRERGRERKDEMWARSLQWQQGSKRFGRRLASESDGQV